MFLLGMDRPVSHSVSGQSFDSSVRSQTEQTLGVIKAAYESEKLPDFMELLDKDFEDRLNFQANLQNYFINTKDNEISFVIDSLLINQDKISVRLHWFKKSTTNTGFFSKTQGSSHFVFYKYPSGLKLVYIRKDNPFF